MIQTKLSSQDVPFRAVGTLENGDLLLWNTKHNHAVAATIWVPSKEEIHLQAENQIDGMGQ